jgi:hypothetical protein
MAVTVRLIWPCPRRSLDYALGRRQNFASHRARDPESRILHDVRPAHGWILERLHKLAVLLAALSGDNGRHEHAIGASSERDILGRWLNSRAGRPGPEREAQR